MGLSGSRRLGQKDTRLAREKKKAKNLKIVLGVVLGTVGAALLATSVYFVARKKS